MPKFPSSRLDLKVFAVAREKLDKKKMEVLMSIHVGLNELVLQEHLLLLRFEEHWNEQDYLTR